MPDVELKLAVLIRRFSVKLPGQDLRHHGYPMDYLIHIAGPVGLVGLAFTFHLLVLVWPR